MYNDWNKNDLGPKFRFFSINNAILLLLRWQKHSLLALNQCLSNIVRAVTQIKVAIMPYYHRRTRRGIEGAAASPGLKNFRANSVTRASVSCSKILNAKSIFNTVKIFRASAGCSKILNVKSIFNTVKRFRAYSVFRASASC